MTTALLLASLLAFAPPPVVGGADLVPSGDPLVGDITLRTEYPKVTPIPWVRANDVHCGAPGTVQSWECIGEGVLGHLADLYNRIDELEAEVRMLRLEAAAAHEVHVDAVHHKKGDVVSGPGGCNVCTYISDTAMSCTAVACRTQ